MTIETIRIIGACIMFAGIVLVVAANLWEKR